MSTATAAPRQRDHSFDNIKAVLIFFVVLGHVIVSCNEHDLISLVYKLIYLFHMPVFVFISGYFSKKAAKSFGYSVYSALVPYVIFALIYKIAECIISPEKLGEMPGYLGDVPFSYWYLLCLFYWRLITPILAKLGKFALPLTIIIGLLGGFVGGSVPLSAARACTFLPYYWLGYVFTTETVANVRRANRWVCLGLLAAILGGSTWVFTNINLPYVRLLQMKVTYEACGLSVVEGVGVRLVQYILGTAICLLAINLMPNRKNILTHVGQSTMSIYIGHGYVVIALIRGLGLLDGIFAALGPVGCLGVSILTALVITAFFSLPPVVRFFSLLTEWLANICKKALTPKEKAKA